MTYKEEVPPGTPATPPVLNCPVESLRALDERLEDGLARPDMCKIQGAVLCLTRSDANSSTRL
jgi:hypothetical protein